MKIRIKFIPNQQKKFLTEVFSKSNYSNDELAFIAKVHPRSFRDWKKEKLTMTLEAAIIFCKKFNLSLPEKKEILIKRWMTSRSQAGRVGGIARFKKYGSLATKEGRRKGGINAMANLKKNGIVPSVKKYDLPKAFSKKLAEFVGIMLGDGGMTSSQCSITLNSEEDKDYIEYVKSLSFSLFREKPKFFKKKDCKAITIYYNGSFLIQYLCKIGLKTGNKVKQQVDVPDWIKKVPSYRISCLRGLMDTDGGVFLHKYIIKDKKYTYKKISFSNRSLPLLFFVKEVLSELGFTPKLIDKVENKKVWLYNQSEVNRYLKKVGSSNKRLLRYGG